MKKIAKTFLALGMTLSMTVGLTGCEEFFQKLGEEISNIISEEIDEIISSIMDEMSGSIPDGFNPDDFNPDDYIPDDENTGSTGDGSVSDSTVDSTESGSTGNGGEVPDDEAPDDETPDDETAQFDVHFLELGNRYTGDCTYIKAGDTDILIDAGSRKDSATTIASYVNQYCTDGKLEYVIATHAHQDHIAGFVGNGSQGIFDVYRIGTLIDFPKTNATTQIYNNYVTKRSSIIEKYATKHYTALEWWNEESGLTRSIEVADGITMNVLYQTYYENKSSSENNYSVCVLFSQGENHYLFTGDLEKAGEESLVASNDLPKVRLYKAGHHGSKTSSNDVLLREIQPEIVCMCSCAGSSEFDAAPLNTFPTQDFVNRVAPYTDKIYVTTLAVNDSSGKTTGFTSMNGDITVSSRGGEVTVTCSHDNTILKETAWFKANRTWPTGGV